MKKQVVVCALTGVLALGTLGCGQAASSQSETKTEEKTEQAQSTQQTESQIAWTEAADAEAAAKGANLAKFGVPTVVTIGDKEFKDPKFSYANGVAQATYENGAIALVIRKGGSGYTAPLTDRDKTEFASKWTKKYDGLDVSLYGPSEGAATVMTWNDNTEDYGVTYQGLGGEEVTMSDTESEIVVKAVKDANEAKGEEQSEQTNSSSSSSSSSSTSSSSSSSSNSSSSSTNSGSSNSGSQTGNINGFDVAYTADQCMQIACEYAGAGGQAKGPALNLTYNGPITGGGTVYYKVFFNLGDVAYEVQVDAVDGNVISASETFNGTEQLLDEDGNPIEGTEQQVE